MKDFEFIEHTADIGLRIYGKNLEDLFSNAAKALFSLIVDKVPEENNKEILSLKTDDLEELFVTWLNELITLFFAFKFLPASYELKITTTKVEATLIATILGQEFDPDQSQIKAEIKAATYHNLKVEKVDEKYIAEVIFDV